MFEAAIDSLASGDGERAIASLLAAWRASPSSEVADAIVEIGERAKDDVSVAIARVCEGNAAQALERATALERNARDPRIARAVVAWLGDPPFHATASKPFWRVAFRMFAAAQDPASREAFDAAAKSGSKKIHGVTMSAWLSKEASAVEIAMPKTSRVPTAEAATLAKAVAAFEPRAKKEAGAKATNEEALLRAIHENPEDDGARAVYGDWLLERNDPRGEFMTLQLARTKRELSQHEIKREMQLLKKYAKEWTGEPATATGHFTMFIKAGLGKERPSGGEAFDRGFLASFAIAPEPWSKFTAAKLRKLRGHPSFATVVDFTVNPGSDRNHDIGGWPVAEFLADPSLRAMRRLIVPTVLVAELARGPHASRITWIETLAYQNERHVDEAVEAVASFSSLKTLSIVNADAPAAALERWHARLGDKLVVRKWE